ncbi:MAG: hypothetical protein KBA91_03185 [Candidatus Moranbacteria bacterium]|jgi:hypothetical protein|nr:hypothetical protein [Candidatus Moranbacteria bacterium]
MHTYSLRSSLEERARKKSPPLDIVVPKRLVTRPVLGAVRPTVFQTPIVPLKGLDGVHRERRSMFSDFTERSWQESVIRLLRKGQLFMRYGQHLGGRLLPTFAPHKMLYGSLVGGIAFGMVSMAFLEHVFGPGVFARSDIPVVSESANNTPVPATVLAATTEVYSPDQDVFFEYFGQVTKEKYEESIRDMVRGYPIEAMLPYIFEQDRMTAAFLVGIAKKESNWGKRVPVLEDQDCFNYWGYRGIRRMMGSGGHTCFNSRKDAVETVAKRLDRLIESEKLNTPEKMIVWKCGYSCQGHSRESVKKWISDVDMYFSQLNDE